MKSNLKPKTRRNLKMMLGDGRRSNLQMKFRNQRNLPSKTKWTANLRSPLRRKKKMTNLIQKKVKKKDGLGMIQQMLKKSQRLTQFQKCQKMLKTLGNNKTKKRNLLMNSQRQKNKTGPGESNSKLTSSMIRKTRMGLTTSRIQNQKK